MKKTLMALLLGTVIATFSMSAHAEHELLVLASGQTKLFRKMTIANIIKDSIAAVTMWDTVNDKWPLGTMDPVSWALDAYELTECRKRRVHWDEELPPEIEASTEAINGENKGESPELFESDVHLMALATTGIEALYDGEKVPDKDKTAEVATSSYLMSLIQEKFGTPEIGGSSSSSSTTTELQEELRKDWSDDDYANYILRRKIHKQKTGLSGVAKAELLQSVSATDNSSERIEQLNSYVGNGGTLAGQAKIMASLELELANRLNTLAEAQGNTLAVDAAAALGNVD